MKISKFFCFVALVAVITACGGQSGDQTEQQEDEQSVSTITVIGTNDLKFTVMDEAEGLAIGDAELPSSPNLLPLESITVAPGEEIELTLVTRSQLPASAMAHNWVLLAMGTDADAFAIAAAQAADNDYVPQDMTDQVLVETGLVGGGDTVTITFTAPETPGEYDYVCTFPGHYAAGMTGTLIVQE